MLFAMKSLKCHWCVSIRLFVAVEQSFIFSQIVGSVILSLSVLLLLVLLFFIYFYFMIIIIITIIIVSSNSNSNKLLYLHDRIILQYCKSMHMTIKI